MSVISNSAVHFLADGRPCVGPYAAHLISRPRAAGIIGRLGANNGRRFIAGNLKHFGMVELPQCRASTNVMRIGRYHAVSARVDRYFGAERMPEHDRGQIVAAGPEVSDLAAFGYALKRCDDGNRALS